MEMRKISTFVNCPFLAGPGEHLSVLTRPFSTGAPACVGESPEFAASFATTLAATSGSA